MADSREIGMRVGAAANQAATVVGQLVFAGQIDAAAIPAKHAELTSVFIGTMEGAAAQLGAAQAPVMAPAAVAPATVPQTVPQAQSHMEQAFPNTTAAPPAGGVAGYNTTPSGSTRPLVIAEHPELDQWLIQQCQAVGVDQVWDNRGKPQFIQAINEGRAKTPPPFRSATEGVDKGFWPPS